MDVSCAVSSVKPLACTLQPDLPAYPECDVAVDYTEALLADLGPTLLMLYASYSGPPVTREALVALADPVVSVHVGAGDRAEILRRVAEAYPPVLARARERVAALR